MSVVVDSVLTAALLAALAASYLALAPRAPPRLRFAVAAAGLAAWLVPWGSIRIALPSSSTLAAPIGESLVAVADLSALRGAPWLESGALLGYAVAAASLLGLALLAGDWLALRRCLRRWRAASKPGDELRSLLPPELANVPAEIRIVADSDIAAATGWLNPTVWIGDRHTGTPLKLALVHELTHTRQRDPLWLAAISSLRRLYWWNPLVAYLARQGVLAIESTCDRRSAAHFAKRQYAVELASMLLAGATPPSRLVATMRTANLDVLRLRLLASELRLRMRDVLLLAALGTLGSATAAARVIDPPATEHAVAEVPRALPDGAYVPQEYDPLQIDYGVQ